MNNVPWYKKLIAIVYIALIGIGLSASYLTMPFISKYLNITAYWIVFYVYIFLICNSIGKIYLKFSKSEHKEYYHSLWTGGWGVTMTMLMIFMLFAIISKSL